MQTRKERLFTYHTLSDKERKNLIIFELMVKRGALSRTDISKVTDINMVSISNYVKNYIERKLVIESGVDVSTGGRRPELVELNTNENYVVGVDIGPVNLRAVVADPHMRAQAKAVLPRPKGSAREIGPEAVNLIREAIKNSKIGQDKIKMIGIGISDTNLASIAELAEEKLGVETYIGNDASCAAFGEKRCNPAADVEDLLYMYSDVGCGIIIKGDIYFGAGGSAGAIQVPSELADKDAEGGLLRDSQYLRSWGSDLGITNSARREIEKGIGTKMVALLKGDINNLTKEVVIDAARQNDEIALDILSSAGLNLGIRIAYLVNLFNPEIVVVGGGIEKAGELVLDPIVKTVKKLSLSEPAHLVKVIPSALGEDAVSLGAASLAIRELFLKA